jgi:DNA adenine methylase
MNYLGGKYRLRDEIGGVLNTIRRPAQAYWEPFVGAAWVTTRINTSPVFCSDANEYLIALWKALMDGWLPPKVVSEDEYYRVKENPNQNPALTAFVGFGCSWGGKWFGGYARDNTDRNYAQNARNSLLAKVNEIAHLNPVFFVHDFLEGLPSVIEGKRCLIYCDPPYKATTGYDAIDNWSTTKFWEVIRGLVAQGHDVIVSEYRAPDDFKCVVQYSTRTDIRGKNGREDRVERLFAHQDADYTILRPQQLSLGVI